MNISETLLELKEEISPRELMGNGISELSGNGCPVNFDFIDFDNFYINNFQ